MVFLFRSQITDSVWEGKGLLCNPVALLHFYFQWSLCPVPSIVIKVTGVVLCPLLLCAQSKTVSGKELSYEGMICIDYL